MRDDEARNEDASRTGAVTDHGGSAGAAAHAAASLFSAGFEPGPLPPPPRRYLRPSAYWADRWLELRRP